METFLEKAESWLKKYILITFTGGCLIGSFFLEDTISKGAALTLFAYLSVVEVGNIRDGKYDKR